MDLLLKQYGWNDFFQEFDVKNRVDQNLQIGRVVSVKGFIYHLITSGGEQEAELSGKLLYGSDNELLPRVGDWVY
jgi:hypothetical protein